jgi:TPR repeat protein/nucleoid-associated protein YgaU
MLRAEPAQPADLAQVRERAERSDPDAQNTLGNAYSSGSGVVQDYAAALTWYRKAVEQGFSPAEFNLGLAYELGRGVPLDERQAFKYYMMSAEQGFGPAQFNIGNMYSAGRGVGEDLFEASLWYRQAAEKGITEAQFNLGLAYETGRGVKKDEAQAMRWYQPAADHGFARAQYNLGLLLEEGRGVEKNETAAAILYRKAAEQNFASAQNNYGLMMAEGRGGLTKDSVQALMWLNLAVQNGADPAARDFISQGLSTTQLDEAARLLDEHDKKAGVASKAVVATGKLAAAPAAENVKSVVEAPVPKASGNPPTEIAVAPTSSPSAPADVKNPLPEKSAPVKPAGKTEDDAQQKLARLQQQLDEANQALEKSGSSVAKLTAENDRLQKELKAAKQTVAPQAAAAPERLPTVRPDGTELASLREERASLREENSRLKQNGAEAAALRLKNEQLARDNEQVTAFMTGNRRDLDQAQAKVADLQKQLDAAKAGGPPVPSGVGKQAGSADANDAAVQKLTATVAELTAANDKLEKDLDNSKKSTEAALAAQSQAVSAAQPDAYKMEISTLQTHVKELEGQIEDERNSTAKEIASMASKLQRISETSRSLTEANRALLATKENDTGASNDELEQLRGKVRELTSISDDLRQQNQRLKDDAQKSNSDRDALKLQLAETQKAAVSVAALADERNTLQEKLDNAGAELAKAQQENEAQRKNIEDLKGQLTESLQTAEKAQTDLAAQQTRVVDAEKATDLHNTSVAELTQANASLGAEKEELLRQIDALRLDAARVNESARLAQSRVADAAAAQERQRAAMISQLRQENNALSARLAQAQGTLDQIASAARLGTPAAAIASGNPAQVHPASNINPGDTGVRYHTVTEGDSLSRISLRYYGTTNRWQDVYQANRDLLQGANSLRVGMQLRIP